MRQHGDRPLVSGGAREGVRAPTPDQWSVAAELGQLSGCRHPCVGGGRSHRPEPFKARPYDDRVPRWIVMDQLVNLRDVGGIPTTDGGAIATGRLLRSDNLQDLTPSDVDTLLGLGLTDVVDLRSDYEVEMEGPGPLTRTDVVHHQHSFF